jgi:hypothetical protein
VNDIRRVCWLFLEGDEGAAFPLIDLCRENDLDDLADLLLACLPDGLPALKPIIRLMALHWPLSPGHRTFICKTHFRPYENRFNRRK